MNAVLLTGAGFSYNWGGRLAREMNTAIALRLQHDHNLADLLHRNPNFEEALTELQNEWAISCRLDAQESLKRLEVAIVEEFDEMNRNLARATFNFSASIEFTLPEFLVLFDAIFTLNQDLLLEAQYLDNSNRLSLTRSRRWLGGDLPGTEIIPDTSRTGPFDPLAVCRRPKASPQSSGIDPQHQPLFKLHGSTNWLDPNGGRLVIMGGNKPTTMRQHPTLMWYATKFSEYLSRPGARLMVIGYGFRDNHINQIIHDAWLKSGKTLSMFIVGPDGRGILRKVNPTYGKPIYMPEPLEEITVYESTRPLPATFSGNDPGEHGLLIRYAAGN
jgi:hypothetical protein